MKILYTAFKGKNNTSYQVASRLNGTVLFLTNSFQGLEKDIATIVNDYDVVYMLGCNKSLNNKIKIETCAEYNGEWIFTEFDISELKKELTINCLILFHILLPNICVMPHFITC